MVLWSLQSQSPFWIKSGPTLHSRCTWQQYPASVCPQRPPRVSRAPVWDPPPVMYALCWPPSGPHSPRRFPRRSVLVSRRPHLSVAQVCDGIETTQTSLCGQTLRSSQTDLEDWPSWLHQQPINGPNSDLLSPVEGLKATGYRLTPKHLVKSVTAIGFKK